MNKNSKNLNLNSIQQDIGAATDPNTDLGTLSMLADCSEEEIRAAVALNPSASQEILYLLSQDKSDYVKSCAAGRLLKTPSGSGIHPTAIISTGAKLAADVVIGPYTIIHDNVVIDSGTTIGAYCELGYPVNDNARKNPLKIGKNCFIRSHSVFYEDSTFGDNLVTGHRVTVREKTLAGRNLQIGTLSDIQGHCVIGDFVKFHSNVHIGQHSTINDYVWIFPYVVLTNDPHPPSSILMGVTLEKYVAIATMSIILPGVTVKEGALVGAHSSVARDVEPDTVVAGSPAKYICNTDKIKLKDGSNESAYPWRRHFHRGYLPETVAEWIAEFSGK